MKIESDDVNGCSGSYSIYFEPTFECQDITGRIFLIKSTRSLVTLFLVV